MSKTGKITAKRPLSLMQRQRNTRVFKMRTPACALVTRDIKKIFS
jgi:hypothetical protein